MTITARDFKRAHGIVTKYEVSFHGLYHGIRDTMEEAEALEREYLKGNLKIKARNPVQRLNPKEKLKRDTMCDNWLRRAWGDAGIRAMRHDNWIHDTEFVT